MSRTNETPDHRYVKQIFVFADNGNFAIPGVTEDPDGEFVPDCTRCERLRLVGCRRSKTSSSIALFSRLMTIFFLLINPPPDKCYYRCTRTCRDSNGTAFHETVKFALPGNR